MSPVAGRAFVNLLKDPRVLKGPDRLPVGSLGHFHARRGGGQTVRYVPRFPR